MFIGQIPPAFFDEHVKSRFDGGAEFLGELLGPRIAVFGARVLIAISQETFSEGHLAEEVLYSRGCKQAGVSL